MYIYIYPPFPSPRRDEIIPQIKRNIPFPLPSTVRRNTTSIRFTGTFLRHISPRIPLINSYPPDPRSAAYHRNFADRARFTLVRVTDISSSPSLPLITVSVFIAVAPVYTICIHAQPLCDPSVDHRITAARRIFAKQRSSARNEHERAIEIDSLNYRFEGKKGEFFESYQSLHDINKG